MSATGSDGSRLVVLRGNSGCGKSATAQAIRDRLGRGVAWVEQDHLRRIVLRELDVAGGVNVGLIDTVVRYALDHQYDVVLEGILRADHYSAMLERLQFDHVGQTSFYYFDVPLAETLVRHATKPLALEVGDEQIRDWYRLRDFLPFTVESVIDETSTLQNTVETILRDTTCGEAPGT